MSANKWGADTSEPKSLENLESARKRLRVDNSSRKSWSLMDRKPDQEVLLEMGVSLLDTDDEASCDPSATVPPQKLKRCQDIENVNPNVNSVSPRSRYSPRSPKAKLSPNPGPSKTKSPQSTEKSKPLHPSEQQILETSLISEYLIDEETPLGQSVSAGYIPTTGITYSGGSDSSGGRQSNTPLGLEDDLILSRRHTKSEPTEDGSFDILSDEMMLSIFSWLPKRTLAHCMLVCKRWYMVACDETLWTRLDLGNKTIAKEALGRILHRGPVVLRLASSEILDWHPTPPIVACRLQYLDLSMCSISPSTLGALLQSCPGLRKLSLESVSMIDQTCEMVGRCKNLETLNLAMVMGITTDGILSILKGCESLISLNLAWSCMWPSTVKEMVSNMPERMQRLNISGVRHLTDELLEILVNRCPRLLELDVSDCPRLSIDCLSSMMKLEKAEHLAVSRCYSIPLSAVAKLAQLPHLQYLDVWGMVQSTPLAAFKASIPHINVNAFMFSAVARPTVGTRRTSIWGLRTRD